MTPPTGDAAMATICIGGGHAAELAQSISSEAQAIGSGPLTRAPRHRLLLLMGDAQSLVSITYTGPLSTLKTYITSRSSGSGSVPSSNLWTKFLSSALAQIPTALSDEQIASQPSSQATDMSTDSQLANAVQIQISAARSRLSAAEALRLGVANYEAAGKQMVDVISQQYDPQITAVSQQLAVIGADIAAKKQRSLTPNGK